MKAAVAEVRVLAGETLESVRTLALDLRPSALDDLGLVPALEWYTKQYSARLPIRVSFRAVGFDHRLPAYLEVALYRVVQEALTNVAKHADARSATVLLEHRSDSVRAVVEDDGRGFEVSAKLESRERSLGCKSASVWCKELWPSSRALGRARG
jgi:two-component system sensor histidine kinase UhpB